MRRPVLVFAALLALAPLAPVHAHEGGDDTVDEDGYAWGENPKDIIMALDCANTQMNFMALYQTEYRLDLAAAARADRLEVVSSEAWVAGFTIAARSWKAHKEVGSDPAHAERVIPGDPERGPLLRIGLERKDILTPETTPFTLKVRDAMTGEVAEIALTAKRMPDGYGPETVTLYRQWCYELLIDTGSLAAGTSRPTTAPATLPDALGEDVAETVVPSETPPSRGFPLVWVLGGVGIFVIASSVLWVRRRQH
jgi:hypothetical protein